MPTCNLNLNNLLLDAVCINRESYVAMHIHCVRLLEVDACVAPVWHEVSMSICMYVQIVQL